MRTLSLGFCDDFMMAAKPSIYRFDDVRVEAREFRVFKRDETITLEPKAFAVLVYLLENRGQLVTKDELLDEVWKDAFVTPNVLARIVAQLRRALGDDAKMPHYIETVPTRGYRFIAEVEEIEAESLQDELKKQEPTDSIFDKTEKTLAVLPFKLLNPANEGNYLSLGLADSLITKLSNLRHLTVRPTSSILRYVAETDSEQAGRELKVENVIEGAVQQAGNSVRVSVQLVRVADGKPLWGETYDAQMVNIFQVQDEISARIAEALNIRLRTDEQARLAQPPTDNLEAFQLYLRGNFHLYKYTPDDIQKALKYYDEAIALDPDYALAYAGLANAYGIASNFGDDLAALRAESAAVKAVALDSTLAETHAALAALFYWKDRNEAKAQESFNRALELNPNSSLVHHYYSWFLIATGRFDEAQEHLRRALQLDPLSPMINVDQGLPLFFARRYTEARTLYEKVLEFDPHNWYGHLKLAEACEGANDFACAISEFQRAAEISNNDPTIKAQLARALALAGKKDEARQILAQLTTNAPSASPYYIALAHAALDEPDRAFETLNRVLIEKDKWIGWIKVDPRFDSLRRDMRFQSLLQGSNL